MKTLDLTKAAGLEAEKHFKLRDLSTPVIESELYTTLGHRLFELYEKNKIAPEDQREIERLAYLLTAFTIAREEKVPEGFLSRFWRKV